MLKNDKKTKIIIALAVSSFLLAIGSWIYLLYLTSTERPTADWIRQIHYYKWDWLPVLCLAGYGLKLTRGWNPGSRLLKVAVLIVLFMGMALGLLSLLLFVIGHIVLPGTA